MFLCLNHLLKNTYEIEFISIKFNYSLNTNYIKYIIKNIINGNNDIRYIIVKNDCDLSISNLIIQCGFKFLRYRSSWKFFDNTTKTRILSSELTYTNVNNKYYKCYTSGIEEYILKCN